MPDITSGFESFITYVGVRSLSETNEIKEILKEGGGYFHSKEKEPRRSKRVKSFLLEIKVRGLSPEFVVENLLII